MHNKNIMGVLVSNVSNISNINISNMLNISNLRSEHHGGVVVRAPTTLCAFETSLGISRILGILGILGILIISNLKDVKHSALNIWFPPHSLTIIHSYLGPVKTQWILSPRGVRSSIFTSRLTSFVHLSPRPKVF